MARGPVLLGGAVHGLAGARRSRARAVADPGRVRATHGSGAEYVALARGMAETRSREMHRASERTHVRARELMISGAGRADRRSHVLARVTRRDVCSCGGARSSIARRLTIA